MCQSSVVDWLTRVCPEFGELELSEKREIRDFLLIWSFFEQMCLQAQGGMPAVREFVQSLEAPRLDGLDICEYVTYFQNRYYEEGEPTHRYHHLHLERSGNPTEVDEMLCGATQTKADTLIGCLGIVLRYRNNLFHGEKWAYHLHEQENNFRYSSALLQHIMDRVT